MKYILSEIKILLTVVLIANCNNINNNNIQNNHKASVEWSINENENEDKKSKNLSFSDQESKNKTAKILNRLEGEYVKTKNLKINANKIINAYNEKEKKHIKEQLESLQIEERKLIDGFLRNKYSYIFPGTLKNIILKYYYGLVFDSVDLFFEKIESEYFCKIEFIQEKNKYEVMYEIKDRCQTKKKVSSLIDFLYEKKDYKRLSLLGKINYTPIEDKLHECFKNENYSLYSAKLLRKFEKMIFEDVYHILAFFILKCEEIKLTNLELENIIKDLDEKIFYNKIVLKRKILEEYDKLTLLLDKGTYKQRNNKSKLENLISDFKLYYILNTFSFLKKQKNGIFAMGSVIFAVYGLQYFFTALISIFVLFSLLLLLPWCVLIISSNQKITDYSQIIGFLLYLYLIYSMGNEIILVSLVKNIYSLFLKLFGY